MESKLTLYRKSLLFTVSGILIFGMLGTKGLWTQEYRWANIVYHMFTANDFLHPFLAGKPYYDKPLMSYWLIAALVKLTNELSLLTLRIPSAIAGCLSIWSIYQIGKQLRNKETGIICGWLLTTCFYFIFWARVASADILNVSGILFCVYWYIKNRDTQQFFNYFIFTLALAFTGLCKGLIGPVFVFIFILPDLIKNNFLKHLNWKFLLALSIGISAYLLPFTLSALTQAGIPIDNGLYLVYRENILRFFHPFDHQGPVYLYFIYLPIYLLPWTPLFFIALYQRIKWVKQLDWSSLWLLISSGLLFLFLTLSGSRRSYYVLPLVPFAILVLGDWLHQNPFKKLKHCLIASTSILFVFYFILQPYHYLKIQDEVQRNFVSSVTEVRPF